MLSNGKRASNTQRPRRILTIPPRDSTDCADEELISAAWASSKCYQKCADRPDKNRTTVCTEKSTHKESRYCPEEAPHRGCQLQCFTTQSILNHEKSLNGIAHLKDYKLDLPQVKEAVYRNYLKRGNEGYKAPSQYTGADMLSFVSNTFSGQSVLRLPTCVSEGIIVTDFDELTPFDGINWGRNQKVPCTCGNWKSNETRAFMTELGLAKGQRDFESGAFRELFAGKYK
jgi:hypothetical protein